MTQTLENSVAPARRGEKPAAQPRGLAPVTVLLPFYNEEEYIEATLASFAAQTLRPEAIVLVDNASTDRSVEICEAFGKRHPEMNIRIIEERKPGRTNALETGLKAVKSKFVSYCDADTHYPPHYFELAMALAEKHDAVGAMGLGITSPAETFKGGLQRLKGATMGALLAKQCHAGGFGQTFRMDILRKVGGGYSRSLWPYMQADHELAHRVLKHGKCVYHRDLWCLTSARRTTRKRVSWNVYESALYHLTPFALKDWFFYEFLRKRFIKRGMLNINLRAQPWKEPEQS